MIPDADAVIRGLSRAGRQIRGDWWKPVKCGWPYPEGYGVFNKAKQIMLDTGLTEEEARRRCSELNR